MKKKRPRRKTQKPPPAERGGSRGTPRTGQQPLLRASGTETPPRPLEYKVVELSTVDEGSLERTLNQWVSKGWNLDGVQFAMRESSKRPAMAFVFFTREGAAESTSLTPADPASTSTFDASTAASDKLRRLSDAPELDTAGEPPAYVPAVSPYERLRQLAEDDDGDDSPTTGAESSGLRIVDFDIDRRRDPERDE